MYAIFSPEAKKVADIITLKSPCVLGPFSPPSRTGVLRRADLRGMVLRSVANTELILRDSREGSLTVDGQEIIEANILADNGVIHQVQDMLLPLKSG